MSSEKSSLNDASPFTGSPTRCPNSPVASTKTVDAVGQGVPNTNSPIDSTKPLAEKTSRLSLSSPLPPGCTFGPKLYTSSRGVTSTPPSSSSISDSQPPNEPVQIIWVEFPPLSLDNPFFFSQKRKRIIMVIALFFAHITAFESSSYSIAFPSMERDLKMTGFQAAVGITLYGWGFAIGPLVLAPITEEFGRYWTYVISVFLYTVLHLMMTLGKNAATILLERFLYGLPGSIGATIVAGTVADIYTPDKRGLPMSIFTVTVVVGPGLGPVVMCWVEANPHLGWRWIQWIQMIACGVYWPLVVFLLQETRSSVLLRRRAKKMRKERGMADGGRFTSKSEVDKPKFWVALRQSVSRPLLFLALEPVVTFFAIWAALAWGVFFVQIAGLPYIFKTIHGFSITSVGLVYIALVVGALIGFCGNILQDRIYKKRFTKDGIEARLYAPMAASIAFPIGCIILGLTSLPSVPWIAPCVGIVIVMAAAVTIYQCCFIYLAECYGSHASSAVAGMSFLRIFLGSSFALFTEKMFDNLTPRWSLLLMGGIAFLLAPIPFVAFYKGPWIRGRSPYSKILMAEEKRRVEAERGVTDDTPETASKA